ncbi:MULTISPECIES: ATP-binding protein [unclassified Sphingomonas]|uniref:ATP-binding protein n=1 Tax=unclassified Sphingomonas TaxID=196159 RepID=UPI00226A2DA3|nr:MULTISPECIES: ATP-binding protein [unclassified Sphingomonas]
MASRFVQRLTGALVIAVLAAIAVYLVDGRPDGAAVTLVGAVAAALAAMGLRERRPAVANPDVPDADLLVAEVLDAIREPVLLVRAGIVTCANAAARSLLGGHIVGEDVRVAIRHPAAADRLASPAALPDRPVELVGLGTREQRWEMHTGETSHGVRIVHLVDQTGNYAAERMRIDFVANASHELRTPLASILGFIETLSDEAGEDPGIRNRFLKVMFDEARRMQRLVEDLISLSRIEAEKYRLPGETVDLTELLEEVHGELLAAGGPRIGQAAITIGDDLPPVVGDRAQLSQLLHNLINNAMKYGKAGTPVNVTLALDRSGMVRFAVADEGEGIAPQHIPRLTERFYRVDAGRSRSVGGTGLGLAIVKHIAERHRGRLDIASKVGVGTTVAITLPPAEPVSSKGNAAVTQAVTGGN